MHKEHAGGILHEGHEYVLVQAEHLGVGLQLHRPIVGVLPKEGQQGGGVLQEG